MAFEYYTRSGTKMLRCGYTTGTCAALAAAAATRILLTGREPGTVSLMTGKGIPVEVMPAEWGMEPETGAHTSVPPGREREMAAEKQGSLPARAWAAVAKDAGDDADVTDGMLIRADVSWSQTPGITIDGGTGVGRVTKPGLDQPVGNAAINSGPRRMIEEAVRQVLKDTDAPGLTVIVSVPEGETAAKKTFNSKLGIEGGISILGTTGIVEPMSEQALVDTIEVELKQIAASSDEVILAPGNYGADYIAGHDLDALGIPVLKFSNFLGETLDMISRSNIRTVLLVAHAGKLSKVAAGIMNTHSKYADGRNEIFCAHAAICGGSTELCRRLMTAATTDACIELLDAVDAEHAENAQGSEIRSEMVIPETAASQSGRAGLQRTEDIPGPETGGEHAFRDRVIGSILDAVQQKLEHRAAEHVRIGALMFSNVYGLLGMTCPGEEILHTWEERQK